MLVAVYPLALPGPAGVVVAGLAVLGYVLVVRLAGPPVGRPWPWPGAPCSPGWPASIAASAYARMANLAVEAELELGRRERLAGALLEALTDPTAVSTPRADRGRQPGLVRFAAMTWLAWLWPRSARARPVSARRPPPLAMPRVFQPSARRLGQQQGEVSMYCCRYHAPGDAGPFEVTVTLPADGDGAVVTTAPHLRTAANPTHR